MNGPLTYRSITIVSALLLGFYGGCGTGDYEKRLDDRIKELKLGSKFNLLSPPIDVPGTQVSLRVPQKTASNQNGFENSPLSQGAMVDGKTVDPRRVKPNLVDVVDLKLTYEGFIEDANHGKQSYYLYVAVSTSPNRKNYPGSLQADLTSKIPDTTSLPDLKAPTPEGREITWQEFQATGNQQFYYVKPGGDGQFVQLNGTIELLCHDENDTLVILIWRWPAGIEKTIDFKSWIEMVAGCVKIKPKTPAPGGE